MTDESPKTRDILLVGIAAIAFATSGPLGTLTEGMSAIAVACARTGIASVLLFAASPRATLRALVAIPPKKRKMLLLAGGLLAAHFAFFLAGLVKTSLSAAVALVSLEPLAVVVATFALFGIRPTRREIFGLVVATGGAVIVGSGAGEGEHRVLGDVLVLVAVALYGGYVAAARGLRDVLPGLPYVATVYGAAALLLAPVAVVLIASSPAPTPRAMWATLALALVPTLIGHTLVQLAARRVPPVLVALVSPGETVGAIAIGVFAMSKVPTLREGIGSAFVLVGATLAILRRTRAE